MSSPLTSAQREPLFSRVTLLVVAFLSCFATLIATWWVRGVWTPTLPLPAVLLTLLVVLPVGEFIRSRFRLSLGSLLILVSVAAIFLGIFGERWNRASKQRRAVMSIYSIMDRAQQSPTEEELATDKMFPVEQPYTRVTYNKPSSTGNDFVNTPEGWIVPSWIVELLGDDFFFQTTEASIQRADLSSPDALDDVNLSFFNSLYFNNCIIGPESFAKIMSFKDLRDLNFCNCEIKDAHMAEIAKLPSLEALQLVNITTYAHPNEITREGIKEIAKIKTLRHLVLQNLGIGPGELEPLKNLAQLKWLSVPQNPLLTNADCEIVRQMPLLTGANFDGSLVNEDSLPMFCELPRLEWVSINPSSPEVEEQLAADEDFQKKRLQVFFP